MRGIVLDSSGGETESIVVFHVFQSSVLAGNVALTLGDSSLKARHRKYKGCPGMSPMKHSSFGSSDLFLMMVVQ